MADIDDSGESLIVSTTNFALLRYRLSANLSPPPAQNVQDGRKNSGVAGPDFFAAEQCRSLTDGGFTDWYLPAAMELAALLPAYTAGVLPGMTAGLYWSSTEYVVIPVSDALAVDFSSSAALVPTLKTQFHSVRCVRRYPILPL